MSEYVSKYFDKDHFIEDIHEKYMDKIRREEDSDGMLHDDWIYDYLMDCISECADHIEDIADVKT